MSSDSILVTWTRPLEANGNIAKYLVYIRPSQPQGQPRVGTTAGGMIGSGCEAAGHSDVAGRLCSQDVRKETVYVGGDRGAELALEVRRLREMERLDLWVTASTSVGEGPPSARVSQAPISRGELRRGQSSSPCQRLFATPSC